MRRYAPLRGQMLTKMLTTRREVDRLRPGRPVPVGNGGPMTITFKLELTDGEPAEPSSFRTNVYRWSPGDVIPLGASRSLRVLRVRDEDADQPPVLVVEDLD